MTDTKKSTLLWSAAGLLLSLFVLLTVSSGLAGKVLITNSEGITETADAVITCIHTGDWDALEFLVSGNPALDPLTGEKDTAENLIWNAYQQSLHWVCSEDFKIQGPHAAQRITVTCLDISGVTAAIAEILPDPAGQVTPQTLYTVAEKALHSDVPTIQREITLTFVQENGRWQVVPNSALLALLSGFAGS